MSDLIPEIGLEDLVRIIQAGKISELKSCEVRLGESIQMTAIIYHGDWEDIGNQRTKAEYLDIK